MNFAAAAKRDNTPKELKSVQLTGLAAVKIQKHCNDSLPSLVTGQLLGLDVGTTLEVTDCFPFPVRLSKPAHCPTVVSAEHWGGG